MKKKKKNGQDAEQKKKVNLKPKENRSKDYSQDNYVISINPLADFLKASLAKKKSIIRQQKTPNQFKIAHYQLAKSRMKKTIESNGDIQPILNGIEELKNRKPTKPNQVKDRTASIEAMERFIKMKLPKILVDLDYKILKNVNSKSVNINGVEIIISPDVIIRGKINGKSYIGAVKIHISKSNEFDADQSRLIASTIFKYLNEKVAEKDDIVSPELCLSIEIFGDRILSAPKNIGKSIGEIETLCEEIKEMWSAA